MNGRLRGLALALPVLACIHCSAPDPVLRNEPATLHFTPARPELAVRLVHDGPEPLPLSRIRVDHRDADWAAFTLTDRTLPRQIDPGGEAVLHLRVDVDHFKAAEPHAPRRAGETSLTFNAGEPRRIALRFDDAGTPLAASLIRLGLLALLAAGLTVLGRRARLPWSIALPALVAVAIAPLGAGLCPTTPTAILGLADLLQCADGRGGVPLQIWPHPDGLGLVIVAFLFAALGRISDDPAALRRSLGLALALVALVLGRSLDPQAAVQAQAGLRWGLWMQPFAAAALAIAAVLEVQAARAHSPVAGRVAAIGLAALVTTLCLGGADLPRQALSLPHAAAVSLGLALWLAEVTALTWLLGRARAPAWARRAVVPLAIAQILLVVLRSWAGP
ncbi:MAG TPA: hypothetical protein VGB85_24005 [Nannocystis sp.]|jgi:hypothetical protein